MVSTLPKRELIMSHHILLETEPRSSARVPNALNHWAIYRSQETILNVAKQSVKNYKIHIGFSDMQTVLNSSVNSPSNYSVLITTNIEGLKIYSMNHIFLLERLTIRY